MIKKVVLGILLLLVAILLGILAVAATKPDTFHVEHTATINAPAEAVFPLINDFRRWESWSPWEKLDPNMQRTHSGSPEGVGAVYTWAGNSDAGAGRMEITESEEPTNVTIQLDFTEPFESSNITEFMLQPQGESTTVTWSMHGPNQFIGKVMSVFVSMDAMIGSDFEEGLANLKSRAEA